MNIIHRTHVVMTAFGVTAIISLIRDFSFTSRAINTSRNNELDFGNKNNGAPYIFSSRFHYLQDKNLDIRYSTTHQNIRGQFSLILDDENNHGNNDFQHKGILRVPSEKSGKWMRIRRVPRDSVFMVAGEIIRKAGMNYSKYVDDMRLVIDANHTILPSWKQNNGNNFTEQNNEHICHLLRVMTNRDNLTTIPNGGIPPIVLNVTADCAALTESMNNGQGNTILALYGLRLISAVAKVDFEFQCYTNNADRNISLVMKEKARKLRWVFPWFASYQSSTTSEQSWPYNGIEPTQDEACSSSLDGMPIDKMAGQIRNDVRKMAVQLIGPRTDSNRIHKLLPLDVKPWIPNITVDDVIIHFPCNNDVNVRGMVITRIDDHDDENSKIDGRLSDNSIGIVQFNEYTKRITRGVKSIGIITESSIRKDQSSNETNAWCHRGSELLLRYLKDFYASQTINISLYDNDTLPLQYARIAMAKQSFSSFSKFGMIPIIGTFGEGYYYSSVGGDNENIIKNIISGMYEGFENIHLIDANILTPEQLVSMDFNSISEWLLRSS